MEAELQTRPPLEPWKRAATCSLAALCVITALVMSGLLRRWEDVASDAAFRVLGAPAHPGDAVVLLLIDSKSLAAMQSLFEGDPQPWPWRRLVYGAVADFLRKADALAFIVDLDLSGPTVHDAYLGGADSLETARAFAASGHVYLALNLKDLGAGALEPGAGEDPEAAWKALLDANALSVNEELRHPFEEGAYNAFQAPYRALGRPPAVRRLGVVNAVRDPGGVLRRAPLLARIREQLLPSLPLSAYLDLRTVREARAGADGRLHLDALSIPLDEDGRYPILWYGPEGTFPGRTFHETLRIALADYERQALPAGAEPLYWNDRGFARQYTEAEVEAHKAIFRGKVVFLGVNTTELGADLVANPYSDLVPGVEAHATILDNLLERRFLERPGPWGRWTWTVLLCLLLGLGPTLVGGEQRGLRLYLAAFAGALAAWGASQRLLATQLDIVSPLLGGSIAYVSAALLEYFTAGRLKRQLRRTFNRVLQPVLVDFLLTNPQRLELGGEAREITILFSDLQGFSTLAERLPPRELVSVLNRYFSEVTRTVLEHGAYLDKYIGDAVMASWGAPVGSSGHARQACLAALAIRGSLEVVAQEVLASHGVQLVTRMGLQTGEALVGMVGGEGLAHYTSMGDSVVTASRLEGANKVYGTGILLGEPCRVAAGDAILAREIDSVVLKGHSKPVRIYEPLAPSGEATDTLRRRAAAYEAALALYRSRQWAAARDAFGKLAQEEGGGPARALGARCEVFQAHEPPPDWGGEFVMTAK